MASFVDSYQSVLIFLAVYYSHLNGNVLHTKKKKCKLKLWTKEVFDFSKNISKTNKTFFKGSIFISYC